MAEYCGSCGYKYDLGKKVIAVWSINIRAVTLAWNCQPVHPIDNTKQYSMKEKKVVDVHKPSLVNYYNKNMGGLDRMDKKKS